MKTLYPKELDIKKDWWLIDASGQPVGRLATEVAVLLRGKHKVEFSPHIDTGDFVVIINAKDVQFTGRKKTNKKYYSHSGYFGNLKQKTAKELSGTEIINEAVSGMLPKNKMRARFMKKLKVYETAEHPHASQKPSSYLCLKQKEGKTKS